MNDARFDALARRLAAPSSRRDVARGFAGAAVVAVTGAAGLRSSSSGAQDLEATPVLTVEPLDPTVEPTASPTVSPTSTATPTPLRPTATATMKPTESPGRPAAISVAAAPAIELDPVEGAVGASVRMTMSGFASGEAIQVQLFTGSSYRVLRSLTAAKSGRAVINVVIPPSTGGFHQIRANGAINKADASFRVKRSTSIEPIVGPRGGHPTVRMRGFAPNALIQILFYAFTDRIGIPLVLLEVLSTSDGSASGTITIPSNALSGKHRIEGKERNSTAYAGTFFTVPPPIPTPTPTPTPVCGDVGGACTQDFDCCSRRCRVDFFGGGGLICWPPE